MTAPDDRAPKPKRRVGRAVYICVPDETPGPRHACPNTLHDHPLPSGYVAASDVATRRLRLRWRNLRCPDCGLYGWLPPGFSKEES